MEDEIKTILETQKSILEEIENLRYGDATISFGEGLATKVVSFIGSWKFLLIQSVILFFWVFVNIITIAFKFDPYPFILLNLFLSFEAAYASPLILMAQNLSDRKDRRRSVDAYRSIENIEKMLNNMQERLALIKHKSENGKT